LCSTSADADDEAAARWLLWRCRRRKTLRRRGGLRETSPAVYDNVDIQVCSEERLLLVAGEARRGGRGTTSMAANGSCDLDLHVDHDGGHGVHLECRRSSGLGFS
jgi:predicted alpha/beta-hydrolase family hydrolase